MPYNCLKISTNRSIICFSIYPPSKVFAALIAAYSSPIFIKPCPSNLNCLLFLFPGLISFNRPSSPMHYQSIACLRPSSRRLHPFLLPFQKLSSVQIAESPFYLNGIPPSTLNHSLNVAYK